jgi:hypothetical protein
MACPHKFEKYLNLDRLDFEPNTLIVGTFNPSWPETNPAHWFYGRTSNNYFWDVLPRLYGESSLINKQPLAWKAFCKKHKIAITDLITSIEDADQNNKEHHDFLKNYSDSNIAKKFQRHSFSEIITLLKSHPSIVNVYLTKRANVKFWKDRWNPIVDFSKNSGINARTLLTPSGYAFYQQGTYNKLNPETQICLADFIFKCWKEEWHEL